MDARRTLTQGTSPAPWVTGPSRTRLDTLGRMLPTAPREALSLVTDALAQHRTDYDDTGLPLYAGTNAIGPQMRDLHDAQLGSRPCMGWPGAKYQSGMDHVEVIEVTTAALVARVMGAEHAEVRLHSATLANLAVYTAFTRPGDTIGVLSEEAGGHTSHQAVGAAGVRGLRVSHLPYDLERWDVDLAAFGAWLRATRPRLIVVGASLMLFPHRLADIRELCDEVGTLVLYDASHVAGLVAGGRFQRPLAEGAHLVTFSTYKSFGGPAGGAIVTDDSTLAEQVSLAAYPALTANYDAARLAPLAGRCVELLENGPNYADACIALAARLASRLHAAGLCVAAEQRAWTTSHHVAVDVNTTGGGPAAVERLAEAGIWSSAIGLPYQTPGEIPAAVRFGTQELITRGYGQDLIDALAPLVADVVLSRRSPRSVRTDVQALRAAT